MINGRTQCQAPNRFKFIENDSLRLSECRSVLDGLHVGNREQNRQYSYFFGYTHYFRYSGDPHFNTFSPPPANREVRFLTIKEEYDSKQVPVMQCIRFSHPS
jgi:hypothetical protein